MPAAYFIFRFTGLRVYHARVLQFVGGHLVHAVVQPVVVEEVGGRRPVHVDFGAAFVRKIAEGFLDGHPLFQIALIFLFQGIAVVFHVSHDEYLTVVL